MGPEGNLGAHAFPDGHERSAGRAIPAHGLAWPRMGLVLRRRRTAHRIAAVIVAAILCLGAGPGCAAERERDPARAAAAVRRGLQLHAEGDLKAAGDAYREALALDPRNVRALYNLGVIAQSRGHEAAAEDHYRAALEIEPRFVPALFNLATIRSEAGAHGEAADLYRRVVALDEEHAAAHLNLGFALLELGQATAAARAFATAVRLDPDLAGRVPSSIDVEQTSP